MSQSERVVIATVLLIVAAMVGVDLFTDSREGTFSWHLFIEASIAATALFGVFFVLRGSIQLRKKLAQEIRDFSKFKLEAESWRAESRKYVEGLASAIDRQLSLWNLTAAEKEVAFLLLKGMSLKEIAQIRSTAEKTARVQSIAIYAKSGLSGRSELAAFFLEDLLVPNPIQDQQNQHH